MTEFKGWDNLNILNLNFSGLTDISLNYLAQSDMPKLKKLNIQGSKIGEQGRSCINALRMNHIHVTYRTEAERRKEREKKMKQNKK